MQPYDLAIPTLPCRSVSATVAFYKRLGFDGGAHEANGEYAILRRGAVELHFFTHEELVPADSCAGCYIRVLDVEEFFRSFSMLRTANSLKWRFLGIGQRIGTSPDVPQQPDRFVVAIPELYPALNPLNGWEAGRLLSPCNKSFLALAIFAIAAHR